VTHAVHLLDHHEDDKGENDEIDHNGEEGSVGKNWNAGLLDVGQCSQVARIVAQHDKEVGEIDIANKASHDRHDQIANYRVNDLAKRTTNDDTDSQIHRVALDGKFFEFLNHSHAIPPRICF
jgi:hypothetical protein